MPAPVQRPGRSQQIRATPASLIEAVKRRLIVDQFSFDLAADASNTQATCYLDEQADAIDARWDWPFLIGKGWGWLNPPFAHLEPWTRRCQDAAARGAHIALLVPAAVGSNWFRDHVDGHAFVLFLNGRLAFLPEKPTWLYPKDCLLALYGLAPGYEVWNWRAKTL